MKNVKMLFLLKSNSIKNACLITIIKISSMSILKDQNLISIILILIIKIAKKCMIFLKKQSLFYQKILILTLDLTIKFLIFSIQTIKFKISISRIFKKVKHPKILKIQLIKEIQEWNSESSQEYHFIKIMQTIY